MREDHHQLEETPRGEPRLSHGRRLYLSLIYYWKADIKYMIRRTLPDKPFASRSHRGSSCCRFWHPPAEEGEQRVALSPKVIKFMEASTQHSSKQTSARKEQPFLEDPLWQPPRNSNLPTPTHSHLPTRTNSCHHVLPRAAPTPPRSHPTTPRPPPTLNPLQRLKLRCRAQG